MWQVERQTWLCHSSGELFIYIRIVILSNMTCFHEIYLCLCYAVFHILYWYIALYYNALNWNIMHQAALYCTMLYCHINTNISITSSSLGDLIKWGWAAVHSTTELHFQSGPMLSISLNVRLSVCPSVCVFIFEVPFKRLFAPTSQSPMSNIFRDLESLGKSNGK